MIDTKFSSVLGKGRFNNLVSRADTFIRCTPTFDLKKVPIADGMAQRDYCYTLLLIKVFMNTLSFRTTRLLSRP